MALELRRRSDCVLLDCASAIAFPDRGKLIRLQRG
jgi:hypothetical protein